MEGSHDHYKMRLNNYAQGAHLSFRIDSNPRGPDNAVVWLSIVYINDEEYGRGEGPNKRVAEENAANAAWGMSQDPAARTKLEVCNIGVKNLKIFESVFTSNSRMKRVCICTTTLLTAYKGEGYSTGRESLILNVFSESFFMHGLLEVPIVVSKKSAGLNTVNLLAFRIRAFLASISAFSSTDRKRYIFGGITTSKGHCHWLRLTREPAWTRTLRLRGVDKLHGTLLKRGEQHRGNEGKKNRKNDRVDEDFLKDKRQ
ncbi:hypothetical protein F5051DRAFT_475841 [Lentinula edodes]|nr:hypothetical protein F5051DRAFT_475841 [Lentinula edodes]